MTPRTLVLVRPRRSLMTTAFLSILAAMVPVFGVLYWFAAVRGSATTVITVAVVNVIVVVGASVALLRQLTVHTEVTETEVRGSGIFSPMVRVPMATIGSVHLVETYVGQGVEPTTQLVVCDEDGQCLFRNRGNFWHDGDLRAVAEAIPAPLHVVSSPMTMPEFFRAYPCSAYWFERMPLLRVAATVAAAGAGLIATFWLVSQVTP